MDDRETLQKNYPSNSHEKRREQKAKPEEKKVEKIVTGTVRQQKPSFGRKVMAFLFEDDTKSVGQYIVHDVIIPAAKAMLSEAVGGGIDMWLFGERRGNRTYRDGGRSRTNYGAFSRPSDRDFRDRDPRDRDRRDVSRVSRARHDFDDIVFETRGEAETVLSRMVDLVIDYGQVTVADFYELSGITANYTDDKYGWNDLREATVERARGGGYLINLPRTRPVE